LTSTDAFVVVDLPDAPASGVVRRGKKILQSSARDLARSATYTFGAFGVERGGASAGINAEDDEGGEAVAAFVAELAPTVADGQLHLEAGKGVEADQLAELRTAAGASPLLGSELIKVAGITAAATWALGGDLDGHTVAIEGAHAAPLSLRASLVEAGATVVDVWGADEKPWLVWGAKVDAILAGSRPGTLTHQGASEITARSIIPWGPIPVTTKAFAQLRKHGAVDVLPDFVTIAGGHLAGLTEGDESDVAAEIAQQVVDVLEEASTHPDGVLLGACYQAEAFIESWQGSKPFGRPLAA
jgi:glutamate dehydrogenase/leucine dehydrogenase